VAADGGNYRASAHMDMEPATKAPRSNDDALTDRDIVGARDRAWLPRR
jgi:hypothetical protein